MSAMADIAPFGIVVGRQPHVEVSPTPEALEKAKANAARIFRRNKHWPLQPDAVIRMTDLAAAANKFLISLEDPPEKPTPRYLIAGKPVCTPGNLTNIIAQAKNGKSALIAAFIAARINAEFGTGERDLLGVSAPAGIPGYLVHFDTEQSRYDNFALVRRILARAGYHKIPNWYRPYSLAGLPANDLREYLKAVLYRDSSEGIHSVIIDGTADLVNDVNDPEECNGFVAESHGLAIKCDCPIINVVHENPNGTGGKMRGHLGSQLERKAESNLRLKKEDGVTVVFSDKQRGAPILEKDGPRFAWSDEAGMHISVASQSTLREDEKLADLRELAEEVFSGTTLRYAEACHKIEGARRVGSKAAEKWFTMMKKGGVIHNRGFGSWEVRKS